MALKKKETTKVKKDFDSGEILEEVFEKGYATKDVEVIPNKLSAKVRTLSAYDQLEIEKEMESVKGNYAFTVHTYSVKFLSVTVLSYGDKKFATRDEALAFLTNKNTSSIILNKLIKLQNEFEGQVRAKLGLEEINETFFDQAQQRKGPAPSRKELTPEKGTVYAKQ